MAEPELEQVREDSVLDPTLPELRSSYDDGTALVRYGLAAQSKKGEDYWITNLSAPAGLKAFGVFDGHNGKAAAQYCRDNLLQHVLSGIPEDIDDDGKTIALQHAMVTGFVKADKEFVQTIKASGATATLVIIDKWTVTVGSVGDSRCVLDSISDGVVDLTVDHRLDTNAAEVNRIEQSGGTVGRICTADGYELGPLRCWPGGLCLSRSIGDFDVGQYIVPIPHVRQVRLPLTGGRLIIASDGVWDALSSEKVAKCSRGLNADAAAKRIVKEAIRSRGLRDDTTCLIVDLLPSFQPTLSCPVPKPKTSILSLFKRPASSNLLPYNCPDLGVSKETGELRRSKSVEQIYDDDSPHLMERLNSDSSVHMQKGVFTCAVCCVELFPSGGVSVHAGTYFAPGPDGRGHAQAALCASCQSKNLAMQGLLAASSAGRQQQQGAGSAVGGQAMPKIEA